MITIKKLLIPAVLMLVTVSCSPRVNQNATISHYSENALALHEKLVEKVEACANAPSEYLFVMDGYLVDPQEVAKLKELKPSDLIAVEVLSLQAAKAIYGDKAKEHTVLINTRNMNSR
ncbi:hypothetical protein JAO76_07905 [Pontibacter sp. BT310]|uniref:TonB-dependent receptor plug domain-containing protein n=1 Tax=Pontibacter populi TaxID=890055 RepID=A0ABS6XAD7_9BACT|nr:MULTISPECIES: hypothetical protein [Pontibacter]MBJ6118109.1 hypothetical protein [Pontibacter sp. BT310]MBR0570536.1 hypothetical protein [Microvirga sp. STS03]MBW3364962.1 hypothetical protein [Pontibacter populi]